MSVFKINLGDFSLNVVEIDQHHVFTIYLWNSDWNLRTKLSDFTESNPACTLITKHDENAPEDIYHTDDELHTKPQIRTVSTHLKYYNEITPQQFCQFLELLIENGRQSLLKKRTEPTQEDLIKIDQWKTDSQKRFDEWHKKNTEEKTILHSAPEQNNVETNYTSSVVSFGFR